jgi:GNAT superfamily N-acetyltransferase
MEVKLVSTESDLDKACRVLLLFRTNFSRETLLDQIQEQQENGFQLAFTELDGKAICVAGFVIGYKLAWGKHLYVDDLVTDEQHRSTGAGKLMMDWIKLYAKERGCGQIHLDSSVQPFRYTAHRFYLNQGFNIASHHFSITNISN